MTIVWIVITLLLLGFAVALPAFIFRGFDKDE